MAGVFRVARWNQGCRMQYDAAGGGGKKSIMTRQISAGREEKDKIVAGMGYLGYHGAFSPQDDVEKQSGSIWQVKARNLYMKCRRVCRLDWGRCS